MAITVRALGTQYEALAKWTGEKAEAIRRQVEDDHEGPREHWVAWREGEVVGAVHPVLTPDRKLRLFFDRTLPEAYESLVAMVDGPCQTTIDGAEAASLETLRGLGFEVSRAELLVEIPVARTEYAVPAGYRVISASDTGVRELMTLDAALRDDVPGAEGWQPDEQWFREETYDSPFFDPETYLVALDPTRDYAGLVRIWNGPRPLPRLGLIGVLPAHRRRGLARALVGAALNVLAARGESVAIAEVDETNTASRALLGSFGATQTGLELELTRS
ncbi:GNAT family N-acetyltransferase [Kribbella qitaiheensis]|uniref:GNAT family N-acetyltransferase n=1 Tax=Kribbella qitaiheensis TaxID=1544730 RepID=UPI0036187155